MRETLRRRFYEIPSPERTIVGVAMAVSALAVLAYIFVFDQRLSGDQSGYHRDAVLFASGKLFWSVQPFGEAHASAWKAPGYPAWLGFWYSLLGDHPRRVEIVQALLLAPSTVLLAWHLARRLFNPRVAIVTAIVVAIFPLGWEYIGLLFPEALAIPLTLLALIVFWDRHPSPRTALTTGVVLGGLMLVRPTSFFLLAGILAAWWIAAGFRRGVAMTAVCVAVAALVIAPWTIRNAVVLDGFIPISMQDGAAFGTFNDDAANDPEMPWAWRFELTDPPEILTRPDIAQVPEPELRDGVIDAARDYVREHPSSVLEAAWWNGVRRFWDLRPPDQAVDEAKLQGRSTTFRALGLVMYWVMLPVALFGLWRVRKRTEISLPIVAMFIATAIAFMVIGGTRYRAPVEPVVAMLAAAAVLGGRNLTAAPPPREEAVGSAS